MSSPENAWTDRSRAAAEALARVALGDRAAFATLYQQTRSHLFGVILRINPDHAQAEDVLQEVFVNVWRAAHGFDATRAQAMTWLISIARHRAIDSLRRRQTEVPTTTTRPDRADAGDEHADLLDDVVSPCAGPAELLHQAAQARDIKHCMGELTPAQQQCLALAYYQGFSHAEVATSLAQPLGTVKSWVRRALIAMKDCLSRAGHAGDC